MWLLKCTACTDGLSKATNKQLKLCKKIDAGNRNFGEVWEAMWNNKTPVTVNTFNPLALYIDFMEQATMMKELRHSNAVQL